MIEWLRDFRLVPVVLVAIIGLFTLKSFGILLEGGYTFGILPDTTATPTAAQPATVAATRSPTAQTAVRAVADSPLVTGSVPASKPAPPKKPAPEEPKPTADGERMPLDGQRLSPAERAILERLQERRTELDTRAKELDMRESLIQAAEKRLEERINELKQLEEKVKTSMEKRDEAEVTRFNNLVTMYESMKAKDAAKIFDQLERGVLIEVASKINPRQMAEILSQMQTQSAERLTVELANRKANPERRPMPPAELPKIQGQPTAN